MNRRQSGVILASSVAMVALVLSIAVLMRGLDTGNVQVPLHLAIARQDDNGVDVVNWDGSQWEPLVPTDTIVALTSNGHIYTPTIVSILPYIDGSKIALSVSYCADTIAAITESCTGRSFVYFTQSAQLKSLMDSHGDPLRPIRWKTDYVLFVEDPGNGLFEYDTQTETMSQPIIGDTRYSLPASQMGISADNDLIAYSGFSGERVWSRSASQSLSIPGPASDFNTGWLTFSRDASSASAKLAVVAAITATLLGGGVLRVVDLAPTNAMNATVPSSADVSFDFDPEWVTSDLLAFLRGDGDSLDAGSKSMPAAVMTYEVSTATVSEILPDNKIRRALIVPHQSDMLVYLVTDTGGTRKAYGVATSGGSETLLLNDSTTHTALGFPD